MTGRRSRLHGSSSGRLAIVVRPGRDDDEAIRSSRCGTPPDPAALLRRGLGQLEVFRERRSYSWVAMPIRIRSHVRNVLMPSERVPDPSAAR